MPAAPNPIRVALQIMDDWLGLPPEAYRADVYWFSQRLPPDEVLEAVEIARNKIPQGGRDGFKYFCGVCHRRIETNKIRLSWN